jgi:hypothetical protein
MIFGISKTTLNGILAAFLAIIGPLSAFLAAVQALGSQMPGHGPANYTLAIIGAGLTCLAAVARAWVGLLQNDSPPPASPTAGATSTKPAAMILLVLLGPLVLGLTGCPANQSQLQKAATASEQAMIVVQGFQQGEIMTYNEGQKCVASGASGCIVISSADHLFIEQSVSSIAQLDKTVNGCIGSAGTGAAAASCANTAITTIQQLQTDGDLHIKSVQARQDFDLAMIGARTALAVISTILGGS